MDIQTDYHRGYNQEYDPNVVGHHNEGEDENHHEKKSVLKKVKQKAKKIKDTITKHGHGHNHDHDSGHQDHEGRIPDDHDLDEEDDDEEDIVDPEVHGAPMYESAAARSVVSGQPEDLSRPGISYEWSNAIHPNSSLAPRDNSKTSHSGSAKTNYNNDPAKTSVPGLEAPVTEQPKVNFGKQSSISDEPLAPQNTPVPVSRQSIDDDRTKTFVHGKEEYPGGQPNVNLQTPKGLEEDPAAPKDTPDAYTTTNYQTKVADPTGKGGEATGMTPILHYFDKMNFDDEQDRGREQSFPPGRHHRPSDFPFPTGSHDQFSPEPVAPSLTQTPEKFPSVSETMDTSEPQEQYLHNIESDKPSNQSSYTDKISSATSAIADKTVSAKNIVASKLGYGEKDPTAVTESHDQEQDDATKQSSAVDYGKKIAATVTDKLTPVYEKVAEAGSKVMSKLHGPGAGTASEVGTEAQQQDKGVSMTNYISEKLRPGQEDRALSEVITDALRKQKQEEAAKETRPRGKVTESEEVARRLGRGSEDSPTSSMVDKLKGTVGSWFGKSEESQQAHCSSYADEDFSSSTYERRLQESGN